MSDDYKNGLKKIKISKPRDGFDEVVSEGYPHWPPRFDVTDNQMSEIKEWEVGEKYLMVVEVRQTSKTAREGQPVRAEFDIVRYKALSGKSMEDMTDEEFQVEQGKALAIKT